MRENLEKLELFLLSRQKNERILLYVVIPTVLLLFFYYFYISGALEEYQRNEQTMQKLTHKIAKINTKKIEQKIASIKKEILRLKTQNSELESAIMMLQTDIDSNNFSFLTQAQIAAYLETILQSSQKYNIDLKSLDIVNKNIKKYGLLRNVKSFNIDAEANFLNAVRFINSIETPTMILELNNLAIESNATKPHISFEINLFKVIDDE